MKEDNRLGFRIDFETLYTMKRDALKKWRACIKQPKDKDKLSYGSEIWAGYVGAIEDVIQIGKRKAKKRKQK